MYLGNQPALSYTSFAKQDFTTSATTSYTLDHPVTNENEIALFINFVRQEPTTAYSASNTTLTLTSATSASDDMYCVFLGKAVQTVNPPSGSVGSSQVAASIITGQTALGATPADTDELLISDAGTLKRVDYSYLKPTNTPAFLAKKTGNQTISDNTFTKVTFAGEEYDTNSAYASDKFTVPSGEAGKYFFRWSVNYINPNSTGYRTFYLKKNSTIEIENGKVADDTARNFNTGTIILSLSVGDTIKMEVYQNSGTNMTLNRIGGTEKNGIHFGGFKIIE